MTIEAEKKRVGAACPEPDEASATGAEPRRGRARETAADRARRALVGLKVGPSRSFVLAVIGSASIFVAALVIGYLTK